MGKKGSLKEGILSRTKAHVSGRAQWLKVVAQTSATTYFAPANEHPCMWGHAHREQFCPLKYKPFNNSIQIWLVNSLIVSSFIFLI